MEILNNNEETESQAKNILNEYDNMLDFYSYYLQPNCHKIGLTLEQFWNDDPYLYFAYLEAYNKNKEIEYKEKLQHDNLISYLQGSYTLSALNQALQFSKSPKKIYPDKPFDLNLDEKPKLSIEEQNEIWLGYFNSKLK